MRKRQQNRPSNDNQDFWEQIWGAYRQHSSSTAQDDGRPQTEQTATATNSASTVWSTAYVTIHVPTIAPTTRLRANSSSTASYSVISSWPANPSISKSPTSTWVATTSIATASANSTTLNSGLESEENAAVSAAPTADTTMSAIANSLEPERKRAIIGGLSGTIAGLVAVGFLIFLVLRRRRKQTESRDYFEASMHNGEGCPEVMEKFAGFATVKHFGKGSPRSSHIRPPSTTQIAVDEDHRMIRMSTRHWPRPYAVGEGEGYRESMPFGQLRVVNPDLSRPTTPRRPSTETVGSYFRKQQSALAGFVFNIPRSARQSRTEQTLRIRETPTIKVVDPSLSRECVLGSTTTLSFGSYPSLVSLPIVKQHPLEDAFLTPVQSSSKQLRDVMTPPAAAAPRPNASPLQSAAGTASRAFNHLGSTLLQPLRSKSNKPLTPQYPTPQAAHLSTSTYSSRMSRRSDPFDLDRPSLRGSHYAAAAAAVDSRGHNSRFSLYEGT